MGFLVGLILGAVLGTAMTCLLVASRDKDE